MTEPTRQQRPKTPSAQDSAGLMVRLLQFPLLWGGLLTYGFYQLIPLFPAQRVMLERYFCGHPLEYATTALFFVGMAILGLKALGLSKQKAALASNLLDDPELKNVPDPLQRVDQIEARRVKLPARSRRSFLVQRIRDALAYVRDRKSADGLEEHLKYLAELASERLHGSYALVRTITWAVPILGFLGTVMGITIAIANLNFEQYEASMEAVIGGLAVAFDTTTLALTLSLVIVFCSFLVERSEQDILVRVEDFSMARLPVLFPEATKSSAGPLADVQAHAAQQLLERTESLIQWQTDLWRENLESTRLRWASTLESQQHHLDEMLRDGMSATLDNHVGLLENTRSEFLEAFTRLSEQMQQQQSRSLQAQQQVSDTFGEQLSSLWGQIQSELDELRQQEAARVDNLLNSVSERVLEWQDQLRHTTESAGLQLDELGKQRTVLLQVVEEEQNLARLQQRLTDNLDAVRAAETFDETLHNLTAAVHLLTTRAKPRAA